MLMQAVLSCAGCACAQHMDAEQRLRHLQNDYSCEAARIYFDADAAFAKDYFASALMRMRSSLRLSALANSRRHLWHSRLQQ